MLKYTKVIQFYQGKFTRNCIFEKAAKIVFLEKKNKNKKLQKIAKAIYVVQKHVFRGCFFTFFFLIHFLIFTNSAKSLKNKFLLKTLRTVYKLKSQLIIQYTNHRKNINVKDKQRKP